MEIRIPNNEGNLGKYDDETSALVKRYRATAVLMIILGGSNGNGFSVSTTDPLLLLQIPDLLRNVAQDIERQNKTNSPIVGNPDAAPANTQRQDDNDKRPDRDHSPDTGEGNQ